LESHLWRSTTLAPASYPSPYCEKLIHTQSQFSMLRTYQMSMIWLQFLEAFFHDLIPTYGSPLWVWFYFMLVFLAVNLEAQFLDDAAAVAYVPLATGGWGHVQRQWDGKRHHRVLHRLGSLYLLLSAWSLQFNHPCPSGLAEFVFPALCPLFFFTGYKYFYILFFCELLACFWLLHSVYIAIWVIKTQCMILRMIQYLMDCDCFSWPCNLWAIQYSLIANCCCCWNIVAKYLELWFITNIAAKTQ